jgi:hypothetical protein
MANITHPKSEEDRLKNAPGKCIEFILAYSKSYQVVRLNDGKKIGVNLN